MILKSFLRGFISLNFVLASALELKASEDKRHVEKIENVMNEPTKEARNLLPFDTSFETGDFNWRCKGAIDDKTACHGKRSLLLSGKTRFVVTPRIRKNIEPGKKYILSFYAKTGKPASNLAVEVRFADWNQKAHKIKKISNEWTRHEIELPIQKKRKSWFYLVFSKSLKGQVWLDSIQLEKETLTPYQASEAISLSVEGNDAPGNIYLTSDESLLLTFKICNHLLADENYEVICETEDYYKNIVSRQTGKLRLPQGDIVLKKIEVLPKRDKGYYVSRVTLKTQDGKLVKSFILPFGIVGKPLADGNSKDSFWGLHPGRFKVRGENLTQISLEALKRIGVKWVRNYRSWKEDKKGNVSLRKENYLPALKNGLAMLETINIQSAPKWAKDKKGDIINTNDCAEYIEKFIPQLKKYAQCWELVNEPDLSFAYHKNISVEEGARKYAEILKVVYAASKKVAPDVPVAACGVTAAQSRGFSFVEEVMKTAPDCFDIMPIHPYSRTRDIGPYGSSVGPEENNLRKILLNYSDLVKKHNGKQKLWIGELGWSLDVRTPFISNFSKTQAEYLARVMILARSLPEIERVMWFTALGCVEKLHYEYGIWRNSSFPLPATVVYSNLARILQKVKPVRPIMEGDIRAYAFESGEQKRPLVAVWKWNGESEDMYIDLPPHNIEAIDIIGNKLASKRKDNEEIIKLTTSPIFLFGKNVSMNKFCEKIKSATFSKNPVKIKPALTSLSSFSCVLENRSYNIVEGYIKIISPEGVLVRDSGHKVTLSSRQILNINFPLAIESKPKDLNGKEFEVDYRTDDGNFVCKKKVAINLELCYYRKMKDAKSCDLPEFTKAPPHVLTERRNINPPDLMVGWNGTEDLSIKAWTVWDEKCFYFYALVKDDIFHQKNKGRRIWKGDSLQMAFDTQNDAQEGVKTYDKNDYEFTFALTKEGKKAYSNKNQEASLSNLDFYIKREMGSIIYKVAIPWQNLNITPNAGKIIGFNFIVNDNDGNGRNYWMGLNPGGIAEIKDPYSFKKFALIK